MLRKGRLRIMSKRDELEEFKLIAQAVVPAINCIKNTLENHKIDSLLSLTMSADGYLSMNIHEIKDIQLARSSNNDVLRVEKYESYEVQ